MKNEAETAKDRWPILLRMVRDFFPGGNIRIIDKAGGNRYWKVGIATKKDGLDREIFIKVRQKVMTHPEADYRSCFSQALQEAERILDLPLSSTQFLGTIFVDVDGVHYHAGENLNDDWW